MIEQLKGKIVDIHSAILAKCGENAAISKLLPPLLAFSLLSLFVYLCFIVVTGAFTLITNNLPIFLLSLIPAILLVNHIWGDKQKPKPGRIVDPVRLEYNYKIFRKQMYLIVNGIAAAFSIVPLSIASDLDAPVRWTFLGDTPIYHYLVHVVGGEVDTNLLKNTLQIKINQRLESGKIDGQEASSKIYDGMAYPRIMVHAVEQASNFVEVSVVFTTEDYVEMLRNKFVGSIDDSLDIRDVEDDGEDY